MSTSFEAVVVAANRNDRAHIMEILINFTPRMSLELYAVAEAGFIVLAEHIGSTPPTKHETIEDLAATLSQPLKIAVAIRYNDQIGLRQAAIYRNGEHAQTFGDADSIWVPMDDDGEPHLEGPRYAGDAIPEDVECDCIWNAMDAALKAAGFRVWLTASNLMQVVDREDWEWRRIGVEVSS